MGLSEREQKLFEQLERELSGDAEFASRVRPAKQESRGGKFLVLGVLTLLAGVGLLVLAAIWQVAFFGVAAFVVMLIGLVVASSNVSLAALDPSTSSEQKPKQPKGTFFQDRWDRRFGE